MKQKKIDIFENYKISIKEIIRYLNDLSKKVRNGNIFI